MRSLSRILSDPHATLKFPLEIPPNGAPDSASSTGERFELLCAILARLRAPGGCPWDREQTLDSLKPYLLEEAYEVLDAIDARDWPSLSEELGDLLLQPVFLAQIGREEGSFTIDDALDHILAKLVRRHPHVFGSTTAETAGDVKRNWDRIKNEEKAARGGAPSTSLLASVPRSSPALVEAAALSVKAAGAGFDWPAPEDVVAKLHEELAEIEEARRAGEPARIEDEIGDLLFTAVNLARVLRVDPEQALRKTNHKFRRRFVHVEQRIAARGERLEDSNLDVMEELWREAKRLESAGARPE